MGCCPQPKPALALREKGYCSNPLHVLFASYPNERIVTMAEDDALFNKGMPIRREVLGPEYVDASMARADEFMMSFQRATTAWAWGWAWGDNTLDRKTRSLMNLAMLTALNRAPEIKLHVKGALNNGVTVEEIKAALLHATAYCGIPAGLDAFRAAHEVLVSEGALPKKG